MKAVIEAAKESFLQAKGRMERALASTPDDKLTWSPSPSSRNTLAIVAHSASALHSITEMLDGRPFGTPTTAEADKDFREWENQFTTREAVAELFEKNSHKYLTFIDNLSEDRYGELVTLPFGLGQAPFFACASAAANHTNDHCAQIDYLQTIYGDQDWHIGR